MKLRPAVTVGALTAWSLVVTAAPALAKTPDDGEVPGEPMSTARVLLIYVGLPVAIIAVIWLLASVPYMIKAPRYRPGLSWWAAPVWFKGPDAQGPADAGADEPASTGPESSGGTSARW